MTKKKLKMINWLDKEVQKDKIELDREKQELINRIKKLKKEDVALGIDGDRWIFTTRTKTNTVSNVPLLPQAQAIIDKYKNHPYCEKTGHLLPVKSNQKMNAYLKEIAALCKIKKDLTMHIARHTFATTVTLSNGVPIETVSKMLGHTKLATTQIYAKVLEHKVSDDMQKLKDLFLTKTTPKSANLTGS
jgi:site-specific recombinase XerD